MSKSEHTPGPWSVVRAKFPVDGEIDYAIIGEIEGETYVIAEAFGRSGFTTRPNAKTNARLIAAAPELLAALKVAREFVQSETNQRQEQIAPSAYSQSPITLLVQIDAAIAKAEQI